MCFTHGCEQFLPCFNYRSYCMPLLVRFIFYYLRFSKIASPLFAILASNKSCTLFVSILMWTCLFILYQSSFYRGIYCFDEMRNERKGRGNSRPFHCHISPSHTNGAAAASCYTGRIKIPPTAAGEVLMAGKTIGAAGGKIWGTFSLQASNEASWLQMCS